MPKKQKPAKRSASKATVNKTRRLSTPKHRTLRISKHVKQKPTAKLPSSIALLKKALRRLLVDWRLFGGIVLIYGLLTVILVRGLGTSTNLSDLKGSLHGLFNGRLAELTTGFTLFGALLSTAGNNGTPTAGVYQSVLMVVISLALIWTLRQRQAGNKIKVRDGFYMGMYPLIPFVLVLLVIGVQLLPFAAGGMLYNIVIGNGIAVTGVEKVAWGLLFFLLALASLFMLASSLFGLYIVTLPDMTPLKALRSARELVRFRRWTVLRKIILLPIMLLLIAAIVMLPLVLWLTPIAVWTFFLCTMASLAIVHAYMYTLYRELL